MNGGAADGSVWILWGPIGVSNGGVIQPGPLSPIVDQVRETDPQ